MTGWILADRVRHIPEDELHAYLDQALSRSQCVEIECHLAECPRCALERDRVAAVRDRVTALLADAAARRVVLAPPFEQLRAQGRAAAARQQANRARLRRSGLIAASLAGTIAAGWLARGLFRSPVSSPPLATPTTTLADRPLVDSLPRERTLAAVAPVQAAQLGAGRSAGPASPAPGHTDVPAHVTLAGRAPAAEPVAAIPVAVQVTTLSPSDDEPAVPLEGLWQSVDWHEAQTLTGGNVPRIDGLEILDIQVQRASADERPIVVVSQRHPAGGVIRTIEGPFERVAALVEKSAGRRLNTSAASFTPPDYLPDGSGGTKRGLRILTVTGSLPTDSLNTLARLIELRD